MTGLKQRIAAFTKLGEILRDASSPAPSSPEARAFRKVMDSREHKNKWFTPDNVRLAVRSIAEMLEKEKLERWLKPYDLPRLNHKSKTIAVIMAGNIPLVGFHDFLTVLVTGNNILARTSSKDEELIRELAKILVKTEGSLENNISFTDKIKDPYDAVIATGSDNTSRYFNYYFGHKPHIFRKNRNSVAIINNKTSEKDIAALGEDIFAYFGLGCRNVSKLYIEEGVDPRSLADKWSCWACMINHSPYANNYLYNKSLYNINRKPYIDMGFCLLEHSPALSSPVSVIYYDYYRDDKTLNRELSSREASIQCIVDEKNTPYGDTQHPGPEEYADNTDTVDFLNSL